MRTNKTHTHTARARQQESSVKDKKKRSIGSTFVVGTTHSHTPHTHLLTHTKTNLVQRLFVNGLLAGALLAFGANQVEQAFDLFSHLATSLFGFALRVERDGQLLGLRSCKQ